MEQNKNFGKRHISAFKEFKVILKGQFLIGKTEDSKFCLVDTKLNLLSEDFLFMEQIFTDEENESVIIFEEFELDDKIKRFTERFGLLLIRNEVIKIILPIQSYYGYNIKKPFSYFNSPVLINKNHCFVNLESLGYENIVGDLIVRVSLDNSQSETIFKLDVGSKVSKISFLSDQHEIIITSWRSEKGEHIGSRLLNKYGKMLIDDFSLFQSFGYLEENKHYSLVNNLKGWVKDLLVISGTAENPILQLNDPRDREHFKLKYPDEFNYYFLCLKPGREGYILPDFGQVFFIINILDKITGKDNIKSYIDSTFYLCINHGNKKEKRQLGMKCRTTRVHSGGFGLYRRRCKTKDNLKSIIIDIGGGDRR